MHLTLLERLKKYIYCIMQMLRNILCASEALGMYLNEDHIKYIQIHIAFYDMFIEAHV